MRPITPRQAIEGIAVDMAGGGCGFVVVEVKVEARFMKLPQLRHCMGQVGGGAMILAHLFFNRRSPPSFSCSYNNTNQTRLLGIEMCRIL